MFPARLRGSTNKTQVIFDDTHSIVLSPVSISHYNNSIYGFNYDVVMKKICIGLDYVYFNYKTTQQLKLIALQKNDHIIAEKVIYRNYKLCNDLFDTLVTILQNQFVMNDVPLEINRRHRLMRLLQVVYIKSFEHIKIFTKNKYFIHDKDKKRYRKTLSQLYKYQEKYKKIQFNTRQHIIHVLQKTKLPTDLIRYEICEYLGISAVQ